MAKKVKKPTKAELWNMDRMELLKLIKRLFDESKELRLVIRAKNVTVREERMRKREHWKKILRYRELCGRLTDLEKVGGIK